MEPVLPAIVFTEVPPDKLTPNSPVPHLIPTHSMIENICGTIIAPLGNVESAAGILLTASFIMQTKVGQRLLTASPPDNAMFSEGTGSVCKSHNSNRAMERSLPKMVFTEVMVPPDKLTPNSPVPPLIPTHSVIQNVNGTTRTLTD